LLSGELTVRGNIGFFISVIYSAVIVLAIFFVFQAFAQVAAPKEKGLEQLELIDRRLEMGSGSSNGVQEAAIISIDPTEKIFLGFLSEQDDRCLELYEEVMGNKNTDICADKLCYCYLFDPGDGPGSPYRTCKTRNFDQSVRFAGHGCEELEDGVCADRCILAQASLHHFLYDRDEKTIWFSETVPSLRVND
jgi:hypothetical protein